MDMTANGFIIDKKEPSDLVISLAGNPNVGKSSIFNELTGLRQHTGTITDFSSLEQFRQLLLDNSWTWLTAMNVILFTLHHWPCSTTLLTIYKETKSKKWTFASFIIPTIIGVGITMMTTFITHLFHLV